MSIVQASLWGFLWVFFSVKHRSILLLLTRRAPPVPCPTRRYSAAGNVVVTIVVTTRPLVGSADWRRDGRTASDNADQHWRAFVRKTAQDVTRFPSSGSS